MGGIFFFYLSMTWTTPFATRTLGVTTRAWLTKTEPLATVSVRVELLRVVCVPFSIKGL